MDAKDTNVVEVREGKTPTLAKTEEAKAPAESAPAKAGEAEQKPTAERADSGGKKAAKDKCGKKHSGKSKAKKGKKRVVAEEESSDSSSDNAAKGSSEDSDSSDSESESEEAKKKRLSKKRHDAQKSKKKVRAKKLKRPAKPQSNSGSDSDSDSSDSEDVDDSGVEETQRSQQDFARLMQLQQLQLQRENPYQFTSNAGLSTNITPIYDPIRIQQIGSNDRGRSRRGGHHQGGRKLALVDPNLILDGKHQQQQQKLLKQQKRHHKSARLDYKRVDQVWDNTIHNYKLQDTAEGTTDAQYDEYLFHVRRTFDWEGKYKQTVVDIKSKLLRDALQDVMGNIKGVSLVEDTPKLDPTCFSCKWPLPCNQPLFFPFCLSLEPRIAPAGWRLTRHLCSYLEDLPQALERSEKDQAFW